jgi:hypothetical protein
METNTEYKTAAPDSQSADLYVSTEAPARVFTKFYGQYDGQSIEINVTVCANTVTEAIDRLLGDSKTIREKYHLSLAQKVQASTKPVTNRITAAPAVSSQEQPAPGPGPVPAQPASSQQQPEPVQQREFIIHATKMEVEPSADGKVTLKWYSGGHRYPDIYTKRVAEKALALLLSTGQSWTAENLQRVTSYNVTHDVYYKESSKPNSRGNPYKDIVAIRVA